MAYAETTKVPVEKTIGEILTMVKKAGANRVAQAEEPDGITIQFFLRDRLLRFTVRFPENAGEPRRRQRLRALMLVIKAKFESVESQVETFDEAFLPNIVTPGGQTVSEWLVPQIEQSYLNGTPPSMLMLTSEKK